MTDFRHLVADTGPGSSPGGETLLAPARCRVCGALLRHGLVVRGFDGRRCPACLEALAEALREESRAAEYDRRNPWGRGG